MDRDRKVDINVVTGDELASLLGIGKSKADAIIEHRKLSGRFNSIDDLVSIPGIGQGFSDLNFTRLCCFPLEEPKPPPTLNNNGKRVIPRWSRTSKPAMASCWSQTELDGQRSPVATCSRKRAPCSKVGQMSGSSSSAEDPSECVVCSRHSADFEPQRRTNGSGAQSGEDVTEATAAAAGGDPLTGGSPEDPAVEEASPPLKDFRQDLEVEVEVEAEEVEEEVEEVPDPDFRIEVSPPPCGNGDSESLASDQHVEVEADEYGEEEEEEGSTSDGLCDPDEVMGQEQCECRRSPPGGAADAAASTCHPAVSRVALEDDFESISADCDEGCSKFCRDKMKRKTDVDGQDPMAGKKLCLTGSADGDEGVHAADLFLEVPYVTPDKLLSAAALNLKKRIPTKDNPPPELAKWLETFQIWGNAERMMAIDQLIDLCEPTQVRHMMSVIEPQFQRDFISLLPKELALYVLSFLEPKYLLRAAQTCRYWHILAEDNLLWREKCRESGMEEVIMQDDEFVRDALNKKRPKVSSLPSPWKAAYMRQHNIEMNWRFRPIRPPKVLKGHDDHVITCLQFCGTRIVSGSDDNTLKVWSATTGKCLKTLVGHTGGVWSSQMAGHIIVSGSTDRTLKVWNADSGHCIHTLYGHTSTVRCMHLHGNTVVSGSRDATLRVWDIDTGQCLHVLIGHVAAVRCVQYDGRLVVSGAYDYVVKVWNPEREECLHTLQGHTNRVYSLQFDGLHVVSGSLDTSIRVWDVETGACKHTLMGHQSLTSGMELKNNILVSGNADSTVKVWDITTGQCLQTLSGTHKHNSAVTCLQFNSKFVITSSDDGTVKLWDLKTGEFIRNLVALESGGSGGVVWRIRASPTKLVCAVGSRNGTEETKLLVLDFDVAEAIK